MDDYAQKQAVESEAQRIAAKAVAEQKSFPLNMDAALYRTADNMGLGEVKTDEMRFTLGGDTYILQGFVDGILYVKDGEWTNIHKIAWPAAPAPAETSSAAPMSTSTASSMSSAPAAGTPINTGAASGGLESGTTSAAHSTPATPATPPAKPAATPHQGGLGGMLGDLAEKVEDAIQHKPDTSGGKVG